MSPDAQKSKDLGNTAFKQGDYPAAIGHYTTAILSDPTNPTYPLNRAAAYLKLGKHEDAERDCTTVLRLDGKNVKAWFRRGQARMGTGSLEKAQSDFKQVLHIDVDNIAARSELEKLSGLLARKSKARAPAPVDISIPLSQPPLRRRRVPIKIVDPSSSTASPVLSSRRADSGDTAQRSSLPSRTPPPSTTPFVKSFQEAKHARDNQYQRPGGGIFRSSGQHTVFDTKSVTEVSSDKSLDTALNGGRIAGQYVPPTVPSQSTIPLRQPTTESTGSRKISLFDFTKKWNSLQTPIERWNLLVEHVAPSSLHSFFGTSLGTSLLVSFLQVFKYILQRSSQDGVGSLVQEYIIHMTQVPRFDTIVLFMTHAEKSLVEDIWSLFTDNSAISDVARRAKSAWRI